MRIGIHLMLALWVGGALAGCTMIERREPRDGMGAGDSGPDSSLDLTADLIRGDSIGGGSDGASDLVMLSDLVPPDRGLDFGPPQGDMAGSDLGSPGGLVLRGSFTGGAVFGAQGVYELQGQFAWYGRVAGSGGGYSLSGWLR
ncbi:MAG TPA: hypothetical protein VH877_18170 [Polyangia bacterium]|jgi:hypothetical protein|nr:hypothetical protein [Polyangia bacterium]